ncbi:MAG TPA: guanitoxin biosynthesis L-enduracididine beta-hydroxylase GntD [Thermoanaerobaculia bacterium]|nr:guanitoxin biosynthesis L-enduracididine beta-hydroxylase GntD [Thermoanaerobaculia bacterium]
MNRLMLTESEVGEIQRLTREIVERFGSSESPGLLAEAAVLAHDLPRRLRYFLNDFRLQEPEPGICVISGLTVDNDRIGDTPKHWKDRKRPTRTETEEVFLILAGSLLGEVIGWATQQAGYIIHEIFPIAGHEKEQLGTGCEELLAWHNEDAFHSCRGDYLGLLCLRNPDGVVTTWGSCDVSLLTPRHRDLLFEPRYTIRPDESHLQKNSAGPVPNEELSQSYSQISRMNSVPPRIPVLYGSKERPYLRLDPYFMDRCPDDPEAQEALDALIAQIDSRIETVVIGPGDLLIIDNYRVVHGRKPFKARHDGRDRWLKRINITRDLRKSRELRGSSESRVLCG